MNKSKGVEKLSDNEIEKVSGGAIAVYYTDSCHYNPSHFVKVVSSFGIYYDNQCRSCMYNAHRNLEKTFCTYEDSVDK